jgi:serine/threonine-protein kinase
MNVFSNDTQWIPKKIGNHRIIGRLGHGGMGDIYKAVQTSLNRIVALKVLSPQMGRSTEFSKRFDIEAKAISLLEHQNIVSIFEFGEDQGMKYFAMQFVDGHDLGKKLLEKKPLSFYEIIDYSRQICRGLRYAHNKNVIHRDIKPQNVLIDKGNICRLSDFGIAKIYAETNITLTGMAVGTPEYMSPEQAEGESLDIQTDIYSLGIVMYEMVTKKPPFTGNNPVAIAYKQVHELPIPPSALRKDIPKRMELIILKALKKNRMERYRTVEELLHDLDTVNMDEHLEESELTAVKRRKGYEESINITNRRITDRRSGVRRKNSSNMTPRQIIIETLRSQGVSLFFIALLYIIFILHNILYH